jgi:hypothetical protein
VTDLAAPKATFFRTILILMCFFTKVIAVAKHLDAGFRYTNTSSLPLFHFFANEPGVLTAC